MAESVPFDRAAEYYDRTRALPPALHAAVIEGLRAELSGRGVCLEVGVGTGRIALSLASAGVPMVGADLSGPMLDRLVENAGGTAPFPVLQADVTTLPFADGSFGATLASHVLHLVPDWRAAAREMARVVRPGGAVLVSRGSPAEGIEPLMRTMREGMGIAEDAVVVGLDDVTGVDDVLGPGRWLPDVVGEHRGAIEWVLRLVEEGQQSWTWRVPEDVRRAAVAEAREWARQEYGDLEERRSFQVTVRWRAWDIG